MPLKTDSEAIAFLKDRIDVILLASSNLKKQPYQDLSGLTLWNTRLYAYQDVLREIYGFEHPTSG